MLKFTTKLTIWFTLSHWKMLIVANTSLEENLGSLILNISISPHSPTPTALNQSAELGTSFSVNNAYRQVYANSAREANFLTRNSLVSVPMCCYFPFQTSTPSQVTFPDFHSTFCSVKGHFQIPCWYFILTCSCIQSAILSTAKVMPVTINSCISIAVSSIFKKNTRIALGSY